MYRRLAFKLPALAIAGVMVAILVGTASAAVAGRDALRRQALAGISRDLDGYLAGVEQYLGRAEEILTLSGGHLASGPTDYGPGLGAGEDPASVADGVLRTSEIFEYLVLLDADGASLLVRPPSMQSPMMTQSFADRAWFAEAAAGRRALGDLELSFATGRPTVLVATPLRDAGGAVTAVWAGGLRLDSLSTLGTPPSAGSAGAAHGYLTDRYGLVVAHQGDPAYVRDQTDFSSVPSVRAALGGQRGAGFHWNPIEGREKAAAYTSLPGGWAVVFASPATLALEPLRAVTARSLWVAPMAGLLLAGALWLLVARTLRPLGQLREAAASLGAGDLGTRIPVTRQDELGHLAEEFNRMAGSLELKEQRLEDYSGRLEENVAQLRTVVAQRDASIAELDAFAYSVSHDLRAPLRSIEGFSAAVLDSEGGALSEQGRADLARVRRAVARMGELIDDMLRLSRVSRTTMRVQPVDLSAVAREVCAEARAREPDRLVDVRVADGLEAEGDPGLLRVVLEQLVANAWKFTSKVPDARIEVGRAGDNGDARFFVRDNGAGFDPRYAGKLFGAFQRLHSVTEYPGSGIGLATVARIVARHGGSVAGEGTPGAGATFTFTLPQRKRSAT